MGSRLACRGSAAHTAKRPFLATVSLPDRAGCTIGPIVGGLGGTDPWPMTQLAIRCHVGVPVAAVALRDMRLLGLEPTLLAPRDPAANGGAA
jgi:hypothetical protein